MATCWARSKRSRQTTAPEAPCSHPCGWDGETEAQRGQGMSLRLQSWTEERSPGSGSECQRRHSLHCPLGAGPASQPGTWALDVRPAPTQPELSGWCSRPTPGGCVGRAANRRCSRPPGSLPTRPSLSPPLQILQECVKARPTTRAHCRCCRLSLTKSSVLRNA